MELGQSREDYLECLLMLEENGKIRSVDVAKKMNVSKPSVNKAMNVLKEYGFISQENYGDIHLTENGRALAENILNRHRTLRGFLLEVLKVEASQAEEDACKIEHVLSEETFIKLSNFYHSYQDHE